MSSLTIEAEARASDMLVQVRGYTWPTPSDADIPVEPEPTLALMLSSRPGFAEARHRINPMGRRFSRLGDVLFHPPGIAMHARGSGGPTRVVTCAFSRPRFEALTGLDQGGWDGDRLAACFDIRGTAADGVLRRLAREAALPGFASTILVESLGNTLLVDLSRYFAGAGQRSLSRAGQLAPWQLRRLTDYLGTLEEHSPSVAELAALCGVGPDHLGRAFRRTTGETLMRHVEQVRIGRAKALLSRTDLRLKEIAFRLGFPSQSGFSIAFRRATGATPLQFRQEFRRALEDDQA